VSGPRILLVSLGTTAGLRASDDELAAMLEAAGAQVRLARVGPTRRVRTLALTDLVQARAAARAARDALAESTPDAIIYSTVTAALLAPEPGAIRLDTTAAENRTGRHGSWQRPLEARRLARAPLLIPTDEHSLDPYPELRLRSLVVPIPVEPSGPLTPPDRRDIAAITYAADPGKKGLERVMGAWAAARREGETLYVCGIDPSRLEELPEGVEAPGLLDRDEYRALLRRSRLFVTAPRREDHGIAQLEALADGCLLVSTPAPGPYPALGIAGELDPRLVGEDLAGAIRAALDDPPAGYAERAQAALAPHRREAVQGVVSGELLARLAAAQLA
jgi:glycosyltransferase involved in cell wall biosynthesis